MPDPREGAVVAVVASCMMDMITDVDRLPELGETLRGRSFRLGFGGKGANHAVMAALAGVDVRVVARVGDDAFGAMTVDNLRSRGIPTEHVLVTSGATTGVAPILVAPDGANVILIVPGANERLAPDDIAAGRHHLAGATVVIGQLEVPQEATLAAFELVKAKRGATCVLNPAPARAVAPALLEATDILVPNEVELAQLSGHRPESLEAMAAAARELLGRPGPGTVVVTLGERGALVVRPHEARHVPGHRVATVDTTGAGDAFVGALAAELARGRPLLPGVAFANAAAALSTCRHGTQTSFRGAAAVDALLEAQPRSTLLL